MVPCISYGISQKLCLSEHLAYSGSQGQFTLHASRCVEVYTVLSVHTVKAFSDICSYNGVTTARHASRSRCINSSNSFNCIANQGKSDVLSS